MGFSEESIEQAARTAHEVNRAYCSGLGDSSQVPWEQAADWQRESMKNGVKGVINGNTPAQSHEGWWVEKIKTGWQYGAVKDAEAKTHPCMVPYDQLPASQRYKDTLFVTVVKGVLGL